MAAARVPAVPAIKQHRKPLLLLLRLLSTPLDRTEMTQSTRNSKLTGELTFSKADRNRGTVTGGDKGWLELEFAQIGSWLAGGGVVASNRREMA